ncbi:MAG: hypothetical protein ACTSPY_12000 [Candidatus Helarchaeota archaeon]
MTVIKILNKKILDDLQAKLILRLGRKISQQETLDLCLKHAVQDFEDLIKLASNEPTLTPEIAEEIIALFKEDDNTPYDIDGKFPNKNDQEIYNL